MNTLTSLTLHRLKRLQQSSSVWEGDRRAAPRWHERTEGSNLVQINSFNHEEQPEYILWVDGSMGMVRAMDVVEASTGKEALVRALLQAMERPQSPAKPALPQKIIVCDRETQFYLRGVLQGLDIAIEHAEQLPLINEFFANIFDRNSASPPDVPPEIAPALYAQADRLWQQSPWKYLWDHEVISIEIDRWDIGKLYAVLMGRLGLEKGVIFYRSQESLTNFRQSIAQEESDDAIEETFLQQDCLFSLFETGKPPSPFEQNVIQSYGWPATYGNVHPIFGALHPLEGGRPFLYEEEAIALTIALNCINNFLAQHHNKLKVDEIKDLRGKYKIALPEAIAKLFPKLSNPITAKVNTLPELSEEIYHLTAENVVSDLLEPIVHDDLWPENTIFQFFELSWENVEFLRHNAPHAVVLKTAFPQKSAALPTLLIQTSRPKALQLIAEIEDLGDIKAICFNPSQSMFGDKCELGLLIMHNEELHLFGEFSNEDLEIDHYYQRWQKHCKKTKGHCAVVIAMGMKGSSRGNPSPQHILGYYEVPLISSKELGLGVLQSSPFWGVDLDF